MARKKVLIVATSHAMLGATGERTGVWLEELATPYYALHDAGVEVTLASIQGGAIPFDPRSLPAQAGQAGGEQPSAQPRGPRLGPPLPGRPQAHGGGEQVAPGGPGRERGVRCYPASGRARRDVGHAGERDPGAAGRLPV